MISSAGGKTNGISKNGAGALVLGAANTYTGNTSIRAGNLIAAVNGALGPGGAKGAKVQVFNGASLTIGLTGQLNYNTAQNVVLRGSGAMVNGSPIGALTTSLGFVRHLQRRDYARGQCRDRSPEHRKQPRPATEPHRRHLRRHQPEQGRRRGRPARDRQHLYRHHRRPGRRAQRFGQRRPGQGATTVEQGATLNFNQVDYITPAGQAKAQVTLAGGLGSQNDGQIRAFGGNSSFNGTITLAASSSIGVYDRSTVLDFSGTIKETAKSNLTKLGPGSLVLNGPAPTPVTP